RLAVLPAPTWKLPNELKPVAPLTVLVVMVVTLPRVTTLVPVRPVVVMLFTPGATGACCANTSVDDNVQAKLSSTEVMRSERRSMKQRTSPGGWVRKAFSPAASAPVRRMQARSSPIGDTAPLRGGWAGDRGGC